MGKYMVSLKKKNGFTNIELLLVVGVISVLSGATYYLYENTNDKRLVSSEMGNLQTLVAKLRDATIASDYANLDNQKLNDYGIYYQSEFHDFKIEGLSKNSFKVNYGQITARQCNDFTLKTTVLKGEYVISQKVNGKNVSNISKVVSECNNDTNDVEIVFSGLVIPTIASVTPGTPKPPPAYTGEGSWSPAYPDRGDVPSNLGTSGKNVGNPNKPTPGTYIPPTYVVAGNPTPGGGATNPGSFVRPTYPSNNPLGPLVNPPDSGNEWVPAVPPPPPRPPATVPPPPPPPPPPSLFPCNEYPMNFSNFNYGNVNSTVENVSKMSGSQCASVTPYLANQLISENPSYGSWCMGGYGKRADLNALPVWVKEYTTITETCYSQQMLYVIYR